MPCPANKVSFTNLYHCPFFENNSKPRYYVDRIYSIELEIEDTTDMTRFGSYLGLQFDNVGL